MPPSKDTSTRLREAGIYAAAGLFLAFLGPFNATPGFPFWATAFYWIGLIFVGSLTAEGARALLSAKWPDLPLAPYLLFISLAAAAAATLGVMAIETLFIQREMPARYLPTLFGIVWVISLAMTGVGYMAERSILGPPPEAPEGAGPVETFLSRLPLKYRQAELHAVSSEDHYLRVLTSLGEELILMRLADAVRELEGSGLQVHRSWWVATAAVREVKRTGGKLSLVLPSGKEAPVSRTYAAGAKAAGLI